MRKHAFANYLLYLMRSPGVCSSGIVLVRPLHPEVPVQVSCELTHLLTKKKADFTSAFLGQDKSATHLL